MPRKERTLGDVFVDVVLDHAATVGLPDDIGRAERERARTEEAQVQAVQLARVLLRRRRGLDAASTRPRRRRRPHGSYAIPTIEVFLERFHRYRAYCRQYSVRASQEGFALWTGAGDDMSINTWSLTAIKEFRRDNRIPWPPDRRDAL